MATSALTPNLAAATNGPADAAGFAAARAVCRRHATSFYLASIFLPNAKREAAHAVYAFCRMIAEAFDQIDEDIEGARGLRHHPAVASPVGGCATCGPTGSLDARLATFRERLDDIYAGRLELPMPESRSEPQHALHAFARTADAYEIPKQYFMDLAEGCRMDLTVARYATWSALERYCYHAAGVVGLIMTAIFGVTHSGAGEQAIKMGNAIQLTNILRDLKGDWDRGRVYLPLEDMARFRYSERDLANGAVNENFRELMRFQISRARRLYQEAAEGLCWLADDGSRLTASTMMVVHSGILDAIERNDYDVFSRRARLSSVQKMRKLRTAWRLARRTPGGALPPLFSTRRAAT